MSNDASDYQVRETKGQSTPNEIAQFFSTVASSGPQPRLRFVSGICDFNITDAGTWRIVIKDGVAAVSQDATSTTPADCVVTCAAEDFVHLLHRDGYLNAVTALLQGMLTITGDLSFANMVLGSAILEPAGAPSVELQ